MARADEDVNAEQHDDRFAEMEKGLDSIRDKQKTVSKNKAGKLKRKVANTGLVYMSRVPPHMKPNMLRQKLEGYGKIGKIYMVPTQTPPKELKAELKARKADFMKRSREFSEAWIEFVDKEEAVGVVGMLNCQPMGGKKRSRHSEDLWNLKFVPDFKWDDLMTFQKKVKEKMFINEISKAKQERDAYLAELDRGKKVKAILERKQAQGFEIQEPDVPQPKQRKAQRATVVDGQRAGGDGPGDALVDSDDSDEALDVNQAEWDALNDHPVESKRKSGGKHRHDKRRKLLGLDGDLDAHARSKPSTTISKNVLKMFAT